MLVPITFCASGVTVQASVAARATKKEAATAISGMKYPKSTKRGALQNCRAFDM